jgi:hypothetical protein
MLLRNDGAVFGWGLNANGQLEDGSTTNRSSPVQALGIGIVVTGTGGGTGPTITITEPVGATLTIP